MDVRSSKCFYTKIIQYEELWYTNNSGIPQFLILVNQHLFYFTKIILMFQVYSGAPRFIQINENYPAVTNIYFNIILVNQDLFRYAMNIPGSEFPWCGNPGQTSPTS